MPVLMPSKRPAVSAGTIGGKSMRISLSGMHRRLAISRISSTFRPRSSPFSSASSCGGSRIDGIDLGAEQDAEMAAIIRAACVERTLLLFRGQTGLSPAGYLAFAQRFGGRPDLHSLRHYCLPDHHEIFVVGNVHEQEASVGSPRLGLNWHTDHYHLPEPGLFTYLHAIQVPEGEGDTRYANGIAAYEALSPQLKAKV